MRIRFLPRTKLGRISISLIAFFSLFFILFEVFVLSGERGGEFFFSNLTLTIPMLLAAACGIFAFFTGIIGIIWKKERAIFVFLSTLIGLFILLYCLAEIIFPH